MHSRHRAEEAELLEDVPWSVISRVSAFKEGENISVQRIGGLTNKNYLVVVDGDQFVLRVSGSNASYLGINRERELEALTVASSAGLGPEVVDFLLPEGHLVTRYVKGRHLTPEEYRTPQWIKAIVQVVKHLHSLPPVKADAKPINRVRRYLEEASRLSVRLPEQIERLVAVMRLVEEDQADDTRYRPVFTHNDLVSVNIVVSEPTASVTLLDFEFAGMGDIYHDLASLVYCHDNVGPLSPELEDVLLRSYFGEVQSHHRLRLAGMKFMLMLFFSMWGFVQHGLTIAGHVSPVEGFDYLDYGQHLIGNEVAECATDYLDIRSRSG